MPVKKLFIVAIIAAFSVAGVLPSATLLGSSSAHAAKSKKAHGYTARKTGKKSKRATPQM